MRYARRVTTRLSVRTSSRLVGFALFTATITRVVAPSASAWAAQPSAAAAPANDSLTIDGRVGTVLALAASDLATLPRTTVSVQEEGRTVTYEGVLVADLLRRAGVPLGQALRGDALSLAVLATARDGYAVVFSLAELDPAFSGSTVIVADRMDGKPLVAHRGPLRLVSPRDGRAARGVRMLRSLRVVRVQP